MNDDIPRHHKTIMVILALVGIFLANLFINPMIAGWVKGTLKPWFESNVPGLWQTSILAAFLI